MGAIAVRLRQCDGWIEARLDQLAGQAEQEEPRESARYDAGGSEEPTVHLHVERKIQPLVSSAEIGALPDLTCYLRLKGDWPIVRTRLPPPLERLAKVPALVERSEAGTVMEALRDRTKGGKAEANEREAKPPPSLFKGFAGL